MAIRFEGEPRQCHFPTRTCDGRSRRNIYIADKEAHAVRKLLPTAYLTVAGITKRVTGPNPAARDHGGVVKSEWTLGTAKMACLYIVDRDNGYIRKVDTNGIATVLVDNGGFILQGRGLWVSPDESLVFSPLVIRSKAGIPPMASPFLLVGSASWEISPLIRAAFFMPPTNPKISLSFGCRWLIHRRCGQWHPHRRRRWAWPLTHLSTACAHWFLPSGAYLLGTDPAAQLWYVDVDGYIHLLLNGGEYTSHSGDGSWFYENLSRLKISKIKQVTWTTMEIFFITEK